VKDNRILGISMAQKKNSTLEMKPSCRSDTLVTPFQGAGRHIPEDGMVTAERISIVFQQFHILKKMWVRASIFCAGLPQRYWPYFL
jgi:hypothetical protein